MMISDNIAYCFWWTLLSIFRVVWYFAIAVVPSSLVEKKLRKRFEGLGVKITDYQGEKIAPYDRTKYHCEVVVHDKRFYKRFARGGVLALGESYMDGWWECNDIAKFSSRLISGFNPLELPLGVLYEKTYFAKNQQTEELSKRVAEQHYNIGNDLYEAMLDPTMNYTCGYWDNGAKTLEQAQISKMDLIARKLKLKPGMKVLDLGCGFGAAAKYLAEKYNVSVIGYNISEEQVAWARKSCKGLDVEFRLEDYRKATGKYDAIYSIGFFEHVGLKNFREYFQVCHRCLKDDGLTLLHSITMKDSTQPRTERFMLTYIFPGGALPYAQDYFEYSEGLLLVEDVHNFGYSYKLTLLEWYKNFSSNWDKLKDKYGKYQDGKFERMWTFYLLLCAGFFDSRVVNLYQIVYSKNGVEGGYKSVR